MTSASQGGYVVTPSTQNATHVAYHMFDGDRSTRWTAQGSTDSYDSLSPYQYNGSNSSSISDTSGTPHDGAFLKLELPTAIKLDYTIIRENTDPATRTPGKITFLGSTNGTDWTFLKEFSGMSNTALDETYIINDTNYYNHFAFVVKNLSDGDGVLDLGEWELYGIPEYDPEADGVDVTVKSLPNVPNTDWLEVYYDAKDLADGSTTVNDLKPVGTAINGTVAGNTSVTDGAFTFDGSGDYIVSGNTSLGGTPTITYSVWFKTNSINYSGSNSIVMIGYSGNTNSLGFRINSTGHYRFYVYGGSGGESQTTDIIPTLGNWVHATVTYNNGTGQELYLNGKHVRSGYSATSNLSLAANSKVILGNYLNSSGAIIGTASYDGSIANFRLFNRALTSDEI